MFPRLGAEPSCTVASDSVVVYRSFFSPEDVLIAVLSVIGTFVSVFIVICAWQRCRKSGGRSLATMALAAPVQQLTIFRLITHSR